MSLYSLGTHVLYICSVLYKGVLYVQSRTHRLNTVFSHNSRTAKIIVVFLCNAYFGTFGTLFGQFWDKKCPFTTCPWIAPIVAKRHVKRPACL